MSVLLDARDRQLINRLQYGLPIVAEPYAAVAAELGMSEADLLARLRRLLDENILSRFGPMYHAEKLGGALTLAALAVPEDDFERVAAIVNALPAVAHNYRREHALNMWFVVATATPEELPQTLALIEQQSGYPVYNLPKREEFYVGLHFSV